MRNLVSEQESVIQAKLDDLESKTKSNYDTQTEKLAEVSNILSENITGDTTDGKGKIGAMITSLHDGLNKVREDSKTEQQAL
jgi:hypothetical protein